MNERGRGYRLLVETASAESPPLAVASRPAQSRRLLLGAVAALIGIVLTATAANLLARPEPILREGSRGQDVPAVQRGLSAAGYDAVYLDGPYGPLTARAVRGFQRDNRLVVDGEIGPDTRGALRRAGPSILTR